jgi:hypothetical protein
MANWIVDGDPVWTFWQFDVRRWPRRHRTMAEERAIDLAPTDHWPAEEMHGEERASARP